MEIDAGLAPVVPERVREKLLIAVIEGSPYAKVLVDERGRIALVNGEAERLFGYPRDELLGQSIEILVPERFRRAHPALRTMFHASPTARPMGAGRDLYGRRRDGSEIPIEIGLNPIETEAGRFTLAAITDITERRRADELRAVNLGIQRHAEELEGLNRELASASRFKTQFVATMSHELRTPLTAIVGAAELLSRADLGERAKIHVQTINESAESLLSLINSILDFSKIEAGKMDLQAAPFLVELVLDSVADVVAQLGREKGLTLHTYVDPEIPAIRGDAERLRQILLNLLGNAVKFTERGRIVARALPIDVTGREVVLRFEVQDTGIGIAPDVVPLLFEPFVQADASARRLPGTGLGLSISKRLVELMGGEIGLQSRVGDGSLFWFTARFAPAGAEIPAAPRALGGVAALIVSGDDVFAQIIERYMTSWGMESRRARGRADVLNALESPNEPSWVAIVDLDDVGDSAMAELIDAIKSVSPERVVTIGGSGPLRKPVRRSYLFDAIVRAADLGGPSPDGTVPEKPETAEPAPANGPILVAEDNVRLQRLLRLQFEELGFPVEFVSDGREAVEALRCKRYSMIFMDCQMPNMDGFDAARTIRVDERATGRHTPITAMTANAFAEDRDACLAAGMDDYLPKPVKLADLKLQVDRWARAR